MFQTPGEWETVLLPLRDFVLTANGRMLIKQLGMDRSRVKTIGLSLTRQETDFDLQIDWIKGLNTEKTMGDYDLITHEEFMKQTEKRRYKWY